MESLSPLKSDLHLNLFAS